MRKLTDDPDQVKRKLILKTPKSPKTKLKTGVPKVNSVRRSAQDSATDGLDDVEPKSTAKEVPNEASVEERLLEVVELADRAGNAGSPYAFSFDESSKDGKAKSNPLDIRLGGFGLKPKTTPIV